MRFADIVGHAHAKEILLRAARRDRVPHAFLFAGPDGVGKRRMALAMLSFLVCRDRGDADDACGQCRPCRMVEAGTFADLAVLAPEKGTIKIDTIREATPRLNFQPLVGPWKCLLIDDAHTMTLEAANAALKTLEEPPDRTLFVLVTSHPDELPRTVMSRCVTLHFGALPTADVAALVARERDIPEDDALAAAALSRGSPGRALRLLDSPILAEREAFIATFLDLAGKGPADRLDFANGIASSKEEAADTAILLESLIQDVLLAAAGRPDSDLCNRDMAGPIRAFAERVGVDGALEVAGAWLDWDAVRRYHPDMRSAMDRVLLGFR
jgi:DNA polymerase-3 subunit delta'